MQRNLPVIAALVVIPLIAVTALPISRYLQSDIETLPMDDAARKNIAGSFARLSQGVTHYEAAGPEGGIPVLLIPGFSVTYSVWDPTFAGLSQAGIRVIRYDLFGRGYSDRPSGRYDADFYDRQVLDLLDALHVQQADVGGVSMGGPIAVTFAARHPERVRRVLLFDPGYWTGISLPFAMRMPVLGEYNMAVGLAPALPRSQWEDFSHPQRFPHYLDSYMEQIKYQGFRRALLATLRNYLTTDVTPAYRNVGKSGKPVLLIWGTEDKDTPIGLSSDVRKDLPQAEFHPIEDSAHIPHYEHPEVVNPIVIEFLKR